MLFNSFTFLFVFLPIVAIGFHALASSGARQFPLQLLLFVASCAFLAFGGLNNLVLLLVSLVANYIFLHQLVRSEKEASRRLWLIAAVVFNLVFIGVFKYADFVLYSLTSIGIVQVAALDIPLPLAISFYSFEMIALTVDTWRYRAKLPPFLQVGLFASIFPHLIAGPIVRFNEIQKDITTLRPIQLDNLALGMSIVLVGLFKKSAIADSLAPIANNFFLQIHRGFTPGIVEAWAGAVSYGFQIYFDFSGYTDMAIGLALIFGVHLPPNFNSPYKAVSIVDFWHRWHMTLSRYLRDYLYIPLGGNRNGDLSRWRNVFVTMLLGGLWHGASWNFVLWGGGHGILIASNHAWDRYGFRLPIWVASSLTFFAVTALWVIFRTPDLIAAAKIYAGMCGLNGIVLPAQFGPSLAPWAKFTSLIRFGSSELIRVPDLAVIAVAAIIAWGFPNMEETFRNRAVADILSPRTAIIVGLLGVAGILGIQQAVPFIYFRF